MATGIPAAFAIRTDAFPHLFPPDVLTRLRRHVDLPETVPLTSLSATEVAGRLADVQILITGWGCPPLEKAVLDSAPRLRAVIHAAGSVKGHITPEVFERGIAVSSAAAANAVPVAQYTVATALLAAKRAFARSRDLTDGRAAHRLVGPGGFTGLTVGVVGASHIGRLVIAQLRYHGARVLLADPYVDEARAEAFGAALTTLDDLCRTSDIVTVHAPELPQTRHLINAERLALMRDGTVLINTSRGSLVDTDALTARCASGRLDAVLDVTDPEPLPPDHPLLGLPNVWITPHLAGAQSRELQQMGLHAVAEVERFLSGRPLAGVVTQHDLARIA